MIKVIGLGAGGHARVVIEVLRLMGDYELVGLLDPKTELWGSEILGVPVLGGDDLLPQLYAQGIRHAFIGLGTVGDTRPRQRLYEQVIRQGLQIVPAIHPRAIIASSAQIGHGPTIMANAVVNAAVRLGDNVIVNTGAIIEHDCVIGNHVHVATGARLASTVYVGDGAHIGMGASIRQCLHIGRNAVVGAGAVVVDDVPDHVVVAGVPARVLRKDGGVMVDLERLLVRPSDSIREVVASIDRGVKGIVLVVDEQRHLIGTVTDSDVRRVILNGTDLDLPVSELLAHKASSRSAYITAQVGTAADELLRIMKEHNLRQLPLLDPEGHVVDLVTLDELLSEQVMPLQAVIMAGGQGARLRPITEELPKPMLPVGDQPLLERIIEQLRQAGIRRVNITTHYQPDKITSYFGDGQSFGIELNYVAEDRPLGTAGALSLMDIPDEPLLVINGDILTEVNFQAMLAYHREHNADLTIGVRQYDLQVPYGVVECKGPHVQQLREKPQLRFFVNAGIYLLEPSVHRYIPNGQRFDMTDLIQRLLDEGRPVVSFPIMEYWLDIGQLADYEKAQEDVRAGRLTQLTPDTRR